MAVTQPPRRAASVKWAAVSNLAGEGKTSSPLSLKLVYKLDSFPNAYPDQSHQIRYSAGADRPDPLPCLCQAPACFPLAVACPIRATSLDAL